LIVGITRVDDQRQSSFACRRDVCAKTRRLFLAWAVLVVEIESGLADADYLGMACGLHESIWCTLPLLLRLVRMYANRAPDVGMALGDAPHEAELAQPRTNGQHPRDAGSAGARQDARLVACELGEVEVAVAVDQHGAASGSLRRIDKAREHALRLGQSR